MKIEYIERKTGELCVEKVYGAKALLFLYSNGGWQRLLAHFLRPLLAHFHLFSAFYGFLQKLPSSRKKIAPFIAEYGVDPSEFASADFRSFNDFFIRKLKPEKRPLIRGDDRLALPADGRYLVYPRFEKFCVKGQMFDLPEFLGSSVLARRFIDGSLVIARLCPSDYHRFHFPCSGIPSRAKRIEGPLFSVNPIALKRRLSILSENKRMVTEIDTDAFGTLLYVEVGATSVGTIRQTFTPELRVAKGEEKGYFEFGGSCLVLLFEKGRVQFDADLIANTERGLETRANFGESLGKVLS